MKLTFVTIAISILCFQVLYAQHIPESKNQNELDSLYEAKMNYAHKILRTGKRFTIIGGSIMAAGGIMYLIGRNQSAVEITGLEFGGALIAAIGTPVVGVGGLFLIGGTIHKNKAKKMKLGLRVIPNFDLRTYGHFALGLTVPIE